MNGRIKRVCMYVCMYVSVYVYIRMYACIHSRSRVMDISTNSVRQLIVIHKYHNRSTNCLGIARSRLVPIFVVGVLSNNPAKQQSVRVCFDDATAFAAFTFCLCYCVVAPVAEDCWLLFPHFLNVGASFPGTNGVL